MTRPILTAVLMMDYAQWRLELNESINCDFWRYVQVLMIMERQMQMCYCILVRHL
jgi:hypothetical protein